MGEGYGVDPAKLQETAQGINEAIGELKTLGIAEAGEIGRGFSELSLRGMQVGHQGLEQAFGDFCERWSWGVRTLVQDGNEIAGRLHLSAGEYHDAEQYAVGVLKDITNDAVGDPHKQDEQVEHGSWQDIADDSPLHPDYRSESLEQAGQHMSRTWRTEGRDLAEGPYGLGRDAAGALGYGKEFDEAADRTFGADTGHEGQ